MFLLSSQESEGVNTYLIDIKINCQLKKHEDHGKGQKHYLLNDNCLDE